MYGAIGMNEECPCLSLSAPGALYSNMNEDIRHALHPALGPPAKKHDLCVCVGQCVCVGDVHRTIVCMCVVCASYSAPVQSERSC